MRSAAYNVHQNKSILLDEKAIGHISHAKQTDDTSTFSFSLFALKLIFILIHVDTDTVAYRIVHNLLRENFICNFTYNYDVEWIRIREQLTQYKTHQSGSVR